MGIEVLPPDVNDSERAVQAGRRAPSASAWPASRTSGVGAVEAIVPEREADGPFTGLVDFCCARGLRRS